jgi:hypothetical protein
MAVQFITVSNTGIQICRRLAIEGVPEPELKNLWDLACQQSRQAQSQAFHPFLELATRAHIACDQRLEASGWIPCEPNPNELSLFRLIKIGSQLFVDLVIDTQNGAGRQVNNTIPCIVAGGWFFAKKKYHVADIFITDFSKPQNVVGSLVMDFGNSSTSFVFSPSGGGALQARLIQVHNPFDPKYDSRPKEGMSIIKSTMTLLRVHENSQADPWVVVGTRAEELIREFPQVTRLYAPKKYVRDWPAHLKSAEPSTECRGVSGQRRDLYPTLDFVQYAIDFMLQSVLSSLTNPNFANRVPAIYPQFNRIMLTYPLTWRESDRKVFQHMVDKSARRFLMLDAKNKASFQVEMVCSEPVAVAIYILWECFFHYGPKNLKLAANFLGNVMDMPEMRLLVVDIGGGSTDISLLDISWEHREENPKELYVSFRETESMRFNRAGDRISHIIATAFVQFLRQKYGINESLDFNALATDPAFTDNYKRQAVSKMFELVEDAKLTLVAKAKAGPNKFAKPSPVQSPESARGRGQASQAQPSPGKERAGAIRGMLRADHPNDEVDAGTAGSDEPVWILSEQQEGELLLYFQPLTKQDWDAKLKDGPRFHLTLNTLQEWITADQQTLETRGEPGFMDIYYYLKELQGVLEESNHLPHLVVLSGRTSRIPFLRDLVSKYLKMPLHRIRTLDEMLPETLKGRDYADMDKLAVVCGAQRLRYGDPIHFIPLPPDPIFQRYIGTIQETPDGIRLSQILVRPGERQPRTVTLDVNPRRDIRIGSAFREHGRTEIIAHLSNTSPNVVRATIEIHDDYRITLVKQQSDPRLIFSEWVPGGDQVIVDNFSDTGRIDCEPEGFLAKIVKGNQSRWMKMAEGTARTGGNRPW